MNREQFRHAERSKKTDIQDSNSQKEGKKRHPWTGMSTDNNTGIQTRAMAQCIDNEADTEQLQEAPNPDMNPTVELHGTIALDWYVPDFCNTRVGDLIKARLPLETTEGRILFGCPTLGKFFKTSNFELDLRTGQVFTYLDPPENIGIECQKEPFDPEFLRNILRGEEDTSTMQEEKLERIPSVKKLAGPADVMNREEAEYKIHQYCQLWTMYADNSVELKRKSELSQESAVSACKVYIPYISNIVRQLYEVVKIFFMERELRLIKNRGYFPVPQITPQDTKIETTHDKNELMKDIDEIATAMLNVIKQSEENYARERKQVRARDEQLRPVRQTDRTDFNYLTLANSTPIRSDSTRPDQQEVHFNVNPVRQIYPTTSDSDNQYEPSENDSIIQGAASAPTDQFTTNATGVTGRNDPWR